MPYSLHSHSGEFCKHATGSLEDVVKEAIRQGFEVYGLSEHAPRYRTEDLYPEEAGLSVACLAAQFDRFLIEAERLRDIYSSHLSILLGLETEYITNLDFDGLSELLSRYADRVDYLVGSVHHVAGIPIDFDFETFQRCLSSAPISSNSQDCIHGDAIAQHRQSTFLEMYFDAQYELLNHFHPEIVGHIDLCRLYTPTLRLRDFPQAWAKVERNVKYAVGYGALFEVNAAALRKGWHTAYPAEDVLALILEHGGRFTLSDDSHGPHAVGLNYRRLRDYLLRVGVREVWVLKRNKVPNVGGRFTEPVRVRGDWWDHAFWG
ncbi:histidinol phosphate phosphatase H [Artomyces pyxidatus]|uniref:Histidinol phosphate phosphatase H n=1 Tax=Artomyces pyxidatus TaxID=48021 RepID=A0ACB8SWJ7_9AGAM|nr:histidinol phosphate phosphatase H [Artomyces pyxidatus]